MVLNIWAIGMLLSSLGTAMLFSPEPKLKRIDNWAVVEGANLESIPTRLRQSAEQATRDVVGTAADYAKKTGEGLKQTGETVLESAKGTVKSGTQFLDEQERIRASEMAKQAAKEHFKKAGIEWDEAKENAWKAGELTLDAISDAAVGFKDSTKGTVEAGIEAVGSGVSSLKRGAEKTVEKGKEGILHAAEVSKDSVVHAVETCKDCVKHAAEVSKEGVKEGVKFVVDSGKEYVVDPVKHGGKKVVDSGKEYVVDPVKHGGQKIGEEVKHAYETLIGGMHKIADLARSVGSAAKYRAQEAEDVTMDGLYRAAEKLRERAHEASEVLPNLGQGLAYYEERGYYEKVQKMGQRVDDVRRRIEDESRGYYGKLGQKMQQGPGEWMDDAKRGLEEAAEEIKLIVEGSGGTLKDKFSKEGPQELQDKIYDYGKYAKDRLDETRQHLGHLIYPKFRESNATEERARQICRAWINEWFSSVLKLLHLFTFSSIFGSSLWVTFISGYILSRGATRQQFGQLQSKIFPVYFRVLASGEALLLATHMMMHPWLAADKPERWQYENLFIALLCTLLNVFYLEPRATKLMYEKLKLEKEEGRGVDGGGQPDEQMKLQLASMNKKFSLTHSYSSIANLVSLGCLTWHLWYLNRRLLI